MVEIKELLDLDKTIAKELFDGKTYPWEVLDGIKDFILKLGPTLDPNEFDNPSEGVWVAKDAKVFPSAYLGAPCIIDHGAEIRHCAFIRGSAIVGKNAVVGNSVELKNVVLFDNVQTPLRPRLQGAHGRRLDNQQCQERQDPCHRQGSRRAYRDRTQEVRRDARR